MKQEYTLSKGWKITGYILLVMFIFMVGDLFFLPCIYPELKVIHIILFYILALGLEFFLIIGLISLAKGKIVVDDEKVIDVGIFQTKIIEFKNLKGFHVNQNYIYIIPLDSKNKEIHIPTQIEKCDEFIKWLEQKFPFIEYEEFINRNNKLLQEAVKQKPSDEIIQKRTRLKKITRPLNIASIIVGLSYIYYPISNEIQTILCIILPIIGFLIYKFSDGLILLNDKPEFSTPNLFYTFFVPSIALMFGPIRFDYEIADYSNLLIASTIIFVLISVLIIKHTKLQYNFKQGSTYITIITILVYSFFYSYGVIMRPNVFFDKRQPQIYYANIIDKKESSGNSPSYHITIDKWKYETESNTISVGSNFYNSKAIGETVKINFYNGLFNIHYYTIDK